MLYHPQIAIISFKPSSYVVTIVDQGPHLTKLIPSVHNKVIQRTVLDYDKELDRLMRHIANEV